MKTLCGDHEFNDVEINAGATLNVGSVGSGLSTDTPYPDCPTDKIGTLNLIDGDALARALGTTAHSGIKTMLCQKELGLFAKDVRGVVLRPGDKDYDGARRHGRR